ncbi:hypothetical protein V2G26_018826 [Clonostachys chloroleuca]
MQYRMIMVASMALGTAHAFPAQPQITQAPKATRDLSKRQQPDAAGSSVLDAPMTIAAGQSFDGGNVMYDRGTSCTGQSEGGSSDAVFILESGASLSNVIIGPNQIEGVHCNGGCSITNVWWDAVCEDAFSIKEQADGETTTINGGGATGASDKVIQHNGGGTVSINDFTVSDFGKLYRSCGNCDEMPARHVIVSGGSATNGDILVGINSNMGDTASISGVTTSGVDEECVDFEGVTDGSEPTKIGACSNVGGGGSSGGSSSAATTPAATRTSGSGSSPTSATDDDDEEKTTSTSKSSSSPTSASADDEDEKATSTSESSSKPTGGSDDEDGKDEDEKKGKDDGKNRQKKE